MMFTTTVTIMVGAAEPDAYRGRRGPAWYRGDCHVHSVFSDGELTPEQLAAAARAVGLDFIATTEDNSVSAHSTWRGCAGDDLLVILGEEVTTGDGHWLALALPPGQLIDWRYGVRDGVIAERLRDVHRVAGLCVVAHPHAPYPSGEFLFEHDGFDAVEVWNGLWSSDRPWNADNDAALADWGRSLATDLAHGTFRPAIGNSDTHLAGQIGIPHTVVWAEDRTTTAIMSGLREGRCWIAGTADVDLSLLAGAGTRRAGIGQRLQVGDDSLVVHLTLRGVRAGVVTVQSGHGEIYRGVLPADGCGDLPWRAKRRDHAFIRVEVRHADGQLAALTNPIVIE